MVCTTWAQKRAFFMMVFMFCLMSCSQQQAPSSTLVLDSQKLPAQTGFYIKENLTGTILQSTDPHQVNEAITFIDLNTDSPRVYFSEVGITNTYKKVYETENTITLLLISGRGSVDTFIIDKKTGRFSYSATGSTEVLFSVASMGVCK